MNTNKVGTPIIIDYLPKKNSSASIRNGVINLRISQNLRAEQKAHHIKTLLKNLQEYQTRQPTDVRDLRHFLAFGMFPLQLNWKQQAINQFRIKQNEHQLQITYNPSIHNQVVAKDKLVNKVTQLLAPKIKERIDLINERTINKKLNSVSWRNFHSRWGHCDYRQQSIALAKKLIWCPRDCVEYVIIHELCHLIQPNHSPKFWNLVEEHMPDYKKVQKKLFYYQ